MVKSFILNTFLSIAPENVACLHQAKDQIVNNNPTLSPLYVDYLSTLINRLSVKYAIPCRIYTAILMQESAYNLNAKNCSSGECTDFGIAQIHISSVSRYSLNKKRLLSDLEYSLEAGAKILHDFGQMYKKKEQDYWTRYNSSCKKARKKYKTLVSKWM